LSTGAAMRISRDKAMHSLVYSVAKNCRCHEHAGETYFMKVAILAGSRGTRLSEETETTPKPMIEIGGRPILWHIMKIYAQQGFREFVVLLGYKGDVIKRFFAEYASIAGD